MMRRRIAVLATAVALLAPCLPAGAVTTNLSSRIDVVQAMATTCPSSAPIGTPCSIYYVQGGVQKNPDGSVTRNFVVTRSETLVGPGWNVLSSAVGVAQGATTTAGTITGTGTNAKLKVTLDLACVSPPCAYAGTYTLSLNARRTTTSYSETQKIAQIVKYQTCDVALSQTQTEVHGIVGQGKVKFAGSTKTTTVWPFWGGANGYDNVMGRIIAKARVVDESTCPVFLGEALTSLLPEFP